MMPHEHLQGVIFCSLLMSSSSSSSCCSWSGLAPRLAPPVHNASQCLELQVRQLLNFVVVGGGPTGVEFCGELSDFIKQDLKRPLAKPSLKICRLLGSKRRHFLESVEIIWYRWICAWFGSPIPSPVNLPQQLPWLSRRLHFDPGRYPKIAEYFQVTLVEALPGLLTMLLSRFEDLPEVKSGSGMMCDD